MDRGITPSCRKTAAAPETFDGKNPRALSGRVAALRRAETTAARASACGTGGHFDDPAPFQGRAGKAWRVLLHFGAVDYQCEVWVNGEPGRRAHAADTCPSPLTSPMRLAKARTNCWSRFGIQPIQACSNAASRCSIPKGIWYTPISGIWQTVWLEVVPEVSIEVLKLTPDLDDKH